MASTTTAASVPAVGPIPFKDVSCDQATAVPAKRSPEEEHGDLVISALPSKLVPGTQLKLRCYQGFWLPERFVPAAVGLQRRFAPRRDDVIVASLPKCGTTWLNALSFATMARRSYHPAAADHPLLRLTPHQCVPFLDALFAGGREAQLEAIPSPRLMYTHMPLSMLPVHRGSCRAVYVCREPKDMAVSLWHFHRSAHQELSFADTIESVFSGGNTYGPFWDHILGYWRRASPDQSQSRGVLFLRYEELLRDPAENVRKLARFVGLPFSEAEEEAGVVGRIVELCSLC